MASNYRTGPYVARGRTEDDLYAAPPSFNPFAPGNHPQGPQRQPSFVTYDGANAYAPPPPAVVPAYPMAAPAYPLAQAGTVHGAAGGMDYGGAPYGTLYGTPYGGGYAGGYRYPEQHYQPQQQQQPAMAPPSRPPQPPRNHAAGPRTQFNKPPPPPMLGTNPDIEAGSFSQLNQVTQFTQHAEAEMRHAFIRKVYSILSLQLLASFALTAYLTLDGAANEFVLSRPGLAYTAMAASIVTLLLLLCYRNTYPTNLGLLAIWTLVEAYTISIVTCTFARAGEGEIVMQALGITAAVFIGLTIFTLQSKIDFSFLSGILFAGVWILIIWGVINAIWGFAPGRIYSLIGAVIFSLYIIFDTYLLSTKLPYDEWVLGAISLYLDVINLFLFILQLLAESQQREQQRR